jgi:hypothetical protein
MVHLTCCCLAVVAVVAAERFDPALPERPYDAMLQACCKRAASNASASTAAEQ